MGQNGINLRKENGREKLKKNTWSILKFQAMHQIGRNQDNSAVTLTCSFGLHTSASKRWNTHKTKDEKWIFLSSPQHNWNSHPQLGSPVPQKQRSNTLSVTPPPRKILVIALSSVVYYHKARWLFLNYSFDCFTRLHKGSESFTTTACKNE